MGMIIRIDYGTTLRNDDHAVCFRSCSTESNDRLRLVEIFFSTAVRIPHGVLRRSPYDGRNWSLAVNHQ